MNALGYLPVDLSAEARTETPPMIRVRLEAIPLRISEIVVTPGRFGVMGTSAPVARQTLTREDLETLPQLGEDVFRSMQRIPRVASDDISTRLNVRGGSEMLVMVDGAELYEPYHLKDFDGVLGIVDVQAVGGIDVITGGLPVEYGDKTTGVFTMQTLDPPVQNTRTAVGLSIMNLSLMSRGTFGGGAGSWLVSARELRGVELAERVRMGRVAGRTHPSPARIHRRVVRPGHARPRGLRTGSRLHARRRSPSGLDVFNAYNRANLRSYGYDLRVVNDRLTSRRVGGEELLPILPSLGVRWEF